MCACLVAASLGQAQTVLLHDGNSDATVNLGGPGTLGMNSWQINGQEQLAQQWFWYRLGATQQRTIDQISAPSILNNPYSLSATYTDNANHFSLTITYQLSGGTPGGSDWTSDINETITVNNLSASPLDFHFYQYSDFRLAGTSGNESVNIFQDPNGFYTKATVTKGLNQVSETIDQPHANRAEAALAPFTLNRLNSTPALNLNNTLTAGPDPSADATWAYQWDFTITGNSSVDVLKDKRLSVAPIPEPGTAGLCALGLVLFALRRKRS